MDSAEDSLRLEDQLCFPLYAAARKTVGLYRPFLNELGITYTQYLVMMVMWEHGVLTSRKMGDLLYLDSGTLTPVLKSLEEKGFVTRSRGGDRRNLEVSITPEGKDLAQRAASVPQRMSQCLPLSADDAIQLRTLLDKLLEGVG